MAVQYRELDMTERTVIITGCNRGIGKETALQIAKKGAKVIMACRDVVKAEEVRKELANITKNDKITVQKLDLNSLESVRTFAKEILERESRLDVLICNAGYLYPEKVLTTDGYDSSFQTNYLGHFLLVILLLPILKKSQPSRIVMLSSLLYLLGHIDFENLNAEKSFGKITSYCDTKLAILLFVKELSERLKGTLVTVNGVHPGTIATEMLGSVPWYSLYKCAPCALVNVEEGAKTSVCLAVSADVDSVNGKFFRNCKQTGLAPHADNAKVAKLLWQMSCKFVQVNPELIDV